MIICKNVLACLLFISCYGQSQDKTNQLVGGGCEGCELMYVGMPKQINSEHTSVGWSSGKRKLLLTGKILQPDGRTPAANIVVYYWHTDDKGLYAASRETPQKAIRHGQLRGWVKSDANGNYTIKTSRPAAYPNDIIPQHIHLSIKEPQIKNEYYADLYFDDDPLYLNHKKKYGKLDRAGTELLRVVVDRNMEIAEHNIILGLHIPNYPLRNAQAVKSGLQIGEDQPSFTPFHAYGPDKGTSTCPVCKYGRFHGILFFVGDNPNWSDIRQWLRFLESESAKREKYLKVYFVYGNKNGYVKKNREKELENLGNELRLKNIALTYVPSFSDRETEANLNKINPMAENTFIIYRHRTIIDKYINLKPTANNFEMLSKVLEKTKSIYTALPEPIFH